MIEENSANSRSENDIPDPDEIRERHSIESDFDTIEPLDDESEHREINADDPSDVAHWAEQFQISEADLKRAMVLNGNSIKQIKKYLSI